MWMNFFIFIFFYIGVVWYNFFVEEESHVFIFNKKSIRHIKTASNEKYATLFKIDLSILDGFYIMNQNGIEIWIDTRKYLIIWLKYNTQQKSSLRLRCWTSYLSIEYVNFLSYEININGNKISYPFSHHIWFELRKLVDKCPKLNFFRVKIYISCCFKTVKRISKTYGVVSFKS